MKMIAVSDAHGDAAILEAIAQREADSDLFLYAGDSELQFQDPLFATYHAVRGNMDFDSEFPLTQTIPTPEGTIFLAHGHTFGVNFTLADLLAAAREVGAFLAVYGHTHQLAVARHNGVIALNPGSISQPRGQFASIGGTYAVIEKDGSSVAINYKNRAGEVLDDLRFKF